MVNSAENKVVLVTGGAAGIGLCIVDSFLEHGAKLVIIVDINENLGNEAAAKMIKKYGQDKAVFFKCDVTTDLEESFKIINSKYKTIDVLVNNAGIVKEDSVRTTININVIALMEWSMKFYDYMRTDRGGNGGVIINIASIYGLKITPFAPYYHASKFAVVAFTKSLGHEYNYKNSGVRIFVLCPGYTRTQLTSSMQLRDENMIEDLKKMLKSEEECQEADAVGKGLIDIFDKAESGTVWVVKGSRPAVMVLET